MEVNQHDPVKPIYPTSALEQTTIENAKRIHHLEHLIRAERQELDRLLIENTSPTKRSRTAHLQPSLPTSSSNSQTSSRVAVAPLPLPRVELSSPAIPTTPPALCSRTPQSSPKGIMYSYDGPYSSPRPQDRKPDAPVPEVREMAARGSHWSFVEKARFEAALQKYGPFAWEQIIRAVGTRSEKQVKAYAARYRRRKKLAAKAQLEAASGIPPEKPPPPADKSAARSPLTFSDDSGSANKPTDVKGAPTEGLVLGEDFAANSAFGEDDLFGTTAVFDGVVPKLDPPLLDERLNLPDIGVASGPSEVELLVDQALQGDLVLEEKAARDREAEALEDGYPVEFLNAVFRG